MSEGRLSGASYLLIPFQARRKPLFATKEALASENVRA
jgi:hypothetical protein